MRYQVEVRYSGRKTIGLEIKEYGTLLVRAPYHTSKGDIDRLIEKHADWIAYHMEKAGRRENREKKPYAYTAEEIASFFEKAKEIFPEKVAYFANRIGVDYGRITIRRQKSRWGSCSAKGNLNFNCMLVAMPEEILDYVVVHELCHRIEMNHSERFWSLVEKELPDYKNRRKWLRDNGYLWLDGELVVDSHL